MKKLFALLLVCLLSLGLFTACGKKAEPEPTPTPAPVVTPAPTPTPGPSFTIAVPEGYQEEEMTGTLAYYTGEDGSTICLIASAKDPLFHELDTDALVNAMLPLYSEQIRDEQLRIEVTGTETEPICGYPAYQLELHVKGKGYEFFHLLAGIDADQTYTWVFTGSEEQMESFRECVGSIQNLTAA